LPTVDLTIDLAKITHNARKTLAICRPFGLDVVGVTKGVCGSPAVARAIIAGGIKTLGDARLDNIARMRDAGIHEPMLLLRSPAPSEVSRCIEVKKHDRLLGILSLGQLDTEPEYLFPISPGVTVVESSSDHTIVDLTESPQPPRVGDIISFYLGYFALSRLMFSPYVKIKYC